MRVMGIVWQRFQHTAARRRLAGSGAAANLKSTVSTHSRPKAAGGRPAPSAAKQDCFNTQPPEGGWAKIQQLEVAVKVSTHSRPKAAGVGKSVKGWAS